MKNPKAAGLFIFPGFISRKNDSISKFLTELLIDEGQAIVKYFGMGNQTAYEADEDNGELKPADALSKHKSVISEKLIWLDVDRNGESDHRKMIFIFNVLDEVGLIKTINKNNYRKFLQQVDVIGVLIGSSNFSYNTYSTPTQSFFTARKGEADVLMFKDESNDDFIQQYVTTIFQELDNSIDQQHRLVLSHSATPVPPDFFKKMFEETLEMAIK